MANEKTDLACWTCRIRRKGCDFTKPRCLNCVRFGITCHMVEARPSWMDGGFKQKEMLETIQKETRVGAARRRALIKASAPPRPVSSDFIMVNPANGRSRGKPKAEVDRRMPGTCSLAIRPEGEQMQSLATEDSWYSEKDDRWQWTLQTEPVEMGVAGDEVAHLASHSTAWEIDFIMVYLDYVMPFLYPFHRPEFIAVTKEDVLSLVRQNPIIYHSALSMASFVFTMGVKDVFDDARLPCKGALWKEIVQHAQEAFVTMRDDPALASRISPLQKIVVCQSATQLMMLDQFVGSNGGWTLHLSTALRLLADVFDQLDVAETHLDGVLAQFPQKMHSGPRDATNKPKRQWGLAESTMCWVVAMLTATDIVASTALGSAPVLQPYYASTLTDISGEKPPYSKVDLHMSFGVPTWVFVAIGETSALDIWKKEQLAHGTLQRSLLIKAGNKIYDKLDQKPTQVFPLERSLQMVSLHLVWRGPQHGEVGSDVFTEVWKCSAKIYLDIVVHGWNLQLPSIQDNSARVRHLVRGMTSTSQLRSLAWPVCIAGCVTTDQEERLALKSFLQQLGPRMLLYNLVQALAIMEKVWQDEPYGSSWDIASCLQVLGYSVLLF